MTVMIGVGPHKGSHTAVAIGAGEEPLGKLRVRASTAQIQQLLAWSASWPERAWAVEGAAGLGHLLAQQLVAAGEQVLDVPPKLAARARLLASGNTSKSDPGDACSVAVAALRDAGKKPAAAVRASGTSLTGLFGVGPVIAGTVIGDVRLLRQESGRGQDAQGSAASAQAADQRRHLRGTSGRRPARCRPPPAGPGRATGEPPCLQGGRLTPRTPALRTSHCRACHHHTVRRHGRSRPDPAEPSTSAPGQAFPGRIEETPDNYLTAKAKRTRYGSATPAERICGLGS